MRFYSSILAAALFISSGTLAGASDLTDEPVKISQFMKVDEAPLLPHISDTKKGSKDEGPKLDAVPVMCWLQPEQKPKAVILCVHGLGLHKGTYAQFAERISKEGYAVYAVDIRGFGSFLELPGQRKCDFHKCLEDVKEALDLVHNSHPGLPVFLLGESMGGAISLRMTADHPELIDGLISSVPAAERYGQTKNAIGVGLKLMTAPHKEMDVTQTVVNQSTAKEELRQEWANDPLARFKLSPVELVQFQHFMEENERSAKLITKTPVLMVQGSNDNLVRHDANENIIKHIPSPDSQLIFVDGGEHLIFEEGQFNESVIATVKAWLAGHLDKSNAARLEATKSTSSP